MMQTTAIHVGLVGGPCRAALERGTRAGISSSLAGTLTTVEEVPAISQRHGVLCRTMAAQVQPASSLTENTNNIATYLMKTHAKHDMLFDD